MDDGRKETDELLEELERRIKKEYEQAAKEIEEKLEDYMRRFEAKDRTWQRWVNEGKKTPYQYQQWRMGQLMMGKRWDDMRKVIAEDLTHADEIAKAMINNTMPYVYAVNFNFGTYEIEHATQLDTTFTLYDHNTIERLIKKEEAFIPEPGKTVTRHITEGKLMRWNEEEVQSVMIQSILQGESITGIKNRLRAAVGDSILEEDIKKRDKMTAKQISQELERRNRNAAIRNARTITTGVENAGKMDSYIRANKMGIKAKKQWVATLDGRTRHWHRQLDGKSQDVDKPFDSEFGKIMYPGDPTAHPSNIYNCRCRIISAIEGFEIDLSDISLRHNKNLGEMSYEEWKNEKKSHSDPITKQEDIAETMRNSYIWKYRRG